MRYRENEKEVTDQMKNEKPIDRRKPSVLKIMAYAGIAVGAIVLLCMLALLIFADPLVNKYVKPRIVQAFTEAYPASTLYIGDMHYKIWKNRLGCDSILVQTGEFTCIVDSFSVGGVGWINILRQKDSSLHIFSRSVIDAQSIVLNFHRSRDVLRLGLLHISVPDSEMSAESVKYYSLMHDEQFFGKSQFRQTRFLFDIPHLNILGIDCLALLQGNTYSAKSITLRDMFADILVNMDKPYDINSPNPQMPNELLRSMKDTIAVGSVNIINGRLKYCERYAVKAVPGVIEFTKVNVSVTGIANHTGHSETAVIHGDGLFLNSGLMKLSMTIPLSSKAFSFRYSGSLSTMDATALNSFLEAGEHRRIKSGILDTASFAIDVNSGQANGTLRLAYEDISIAVLSKAGSEKVFFDQIATFIGKIFVIRRSNMPDEEGKMKIGNTQYTRKPDDYFLQFMWFSLRNGIGDVVGFPPR
jgi:hypothetical protein